ncbi:MAG: copper chaperone PCu(A)C [Pseudomonadota bacterium]
MQTNLFAACAALCLGALTSGAQAHDYKVGSIIIDHPMAFETAATARAAGGFLTLTNTGDTDDRLIAVRADFPRMELHTTIEEDSIMRMMQVEAIEIPAGETVALEPGGFHVMFMGLDGDPFEVGEKVPATLVFEQAGEIAVEFAVESRGGAAAMDHSGHGGDHGHGHSHDAHGHDAHGHDMTN